MQLTTTLNKIRACLPCGQGWKTLTTALGGVEQYGGDTAINLLTILDTNGVADMLWCLRATDQDSRKIAAQLTIEFALDALPPFEKRHPSDDRPRAAIQAAKDFNAGLITVEQLHTARHAAYAAYASYDADAAAYAAADAAADAADAAADAAYDAAAYAAYAAADAAADAAYAAAAYAAAAAAAAAYDAYDAYDAAAAADAHQKARGRQATIIRSILEK